MGGLDGTERGDEDELIAAVYDELVALRGAHGKLTVQKFSQYPTLCRICGGGDLLDAFLDFERQLRRFITTGNRDEVAAALSIAAPTETVLDRLEEVASHFEETGQVRDQRTARRWSDRGLRTIATDLAHTADIRGRLGVELLTIEIAGTREAGLRLVVSHLTTRRLDERAPLVRFWKHEGDEVVEQSQGLTIDLDDLSVPEATNETYRLKRYHLQVELPEDLSTAEVDAGDALYSISLEGRDAPMRTVSFMDQSQLGDDLVLRFTTYRTIATVEVVKGSPES